MLSGKGRFLVFAAMLLLGVRNEIAQATRLAQNLGYQIRSEWCQTLFTITVFYLLLFYGYTVGAVAYHELVSGLNTDTMLQELKIWGVIGTIALLAAILAGLADAAWITRTLLSLPSGVDDAN